MAEALTALCLVFVLIAQITTLIVALGLRSEKKNRGRASVMREGRTTAWLIYARMKMKEIAEGGDGKKIAATWLGDFEVDMRVAAQQDQEPPQSKLKGGPL